MKPFIPFLILVLPFLTGCKGQLAGVKVTLAADGSGECEISGVRDVAYDGAQAVDPKGVLQNATEVRSVDLHVKQTAAKFAAIGDFKIGDITFAATKEDGMNLLTVRIPAAPGSKWYGAFGVSDHSLEVWSNIEEEARKTNAARKKADPKATNLAFEPQKPPNVMFEINLPFKLVGQGFETVPLGLTSKVATDHTDRNASLSIPLSEIQSNKLKEVVWKIRYATE